MDWIKVYWTDREGVTHSAMFSDMSEALRLTQTLRSEGNRYVVLASENPNCVSLPGVAGVEQGRLPCGSVYDWKKRR